VFSWCGHYGATDDQTWQTESVKQANLRAGRDCGSYHRIPGRDVLRFLMRYSGYIVGYPAFLFRRQDWERKSGVDERLRIASDFELTGWLAGRGDCALIPRIGYRRRVHSTNVCNQTAAMQSEVARIKCAWLRQHRFLRRSPDVRPWLCGGYLGMAYHSRDAGRYREAFESLIWSLRTGGPRVETVSALCKLPLHWGLTKLFSARHPGTNGAAGNRPAGAALQRGNTCDLRPAR
jgi:hypothetical protein